MGEWKETKIGSIVDVRRGASPRPIKNFISNKGMPWVKIADATADKSRFLKQTKEYIIEEGICKSILVEPETLIVSNSATPGLPKIMKIRACVHDGWLVFDNYQNVKRDYLYYKFIHIRKKLINQSNGSVFNNLKTDIVKNFDILLPPIKEQEKIVKVLSSIDEKIELNNRINDNLEEELNQIFKNEFGEFIDNYNDNSVCLKDIVYVIDNRGKTPSLSQEQTLFPIIDVKALGNNSRVINYQNCTKFVNEETYNTWFRNGHPKINDILISTVGSLAELKIFFDNKGCIAQNVVALRAKKNPYYLYQYLKYIKNDLISYNIGSVQPSIKVTHIIKHPIYMPEQIELKKFENLAGVFSKKIKENHTETNYLSLLRDTLLPKLMSGEIDVSNVEI